MPTASPTPSSDDAAGARLLAAGFFALQIGLGYVWLMSGLSKVTNGSFASKLGTVLTGMTQGQTGPYKSFTDSVVVPNGQLFGYMVMLGELAVGIVLILTALVYLARSSRLGIRGRGILFGLVALASLAAAAMSINYHLSMGANPPWQISSDPYMEGVDPDSVLAILELIVAAVSLRYLMLLRRGMGRG